MRVTRNGRPGEPLDVLDEGAIYYVVVLQGERVPLLKTECTVVPEPVWTDVAAELTVSRDGDLTRDGILVAEVLLRGYRFRKPDAATLILEQEA